MLPSVVLLPPLPLPALLLSAALRFLHGQALILHSPLLLPWVSLLPWEPMSRHRAHGRMLSILRHNPGLP